MEGVNMRKNILLIVLLALTACAPRASDRTESLRSGIEVQVLIGPMCPVMQIGTDCPDQPYQATLTVLDSKGSEVIQFETDEQGRYKAHLEPGQYTIRPETPEEMSLPFADEQSFMVETEKFTRLVVQYDSGIR